jgi:hypothetical protein
MPISPEDRITRLTEIEHSDDEEVESVGEDVEFESTWASTTVLRIHGIVDKDLLGSFSKYLAKHPRVWKDSELLDDVDEDEEEEDEEEDEEDEEDADDGPKTLGRKCYLATTTSSLEKYYSRLENILQASIEQFVARFKHFQVSSIDDTMCIEYRAGSFRLEAPERNARNAFLLVAFVMLSDTADEIVFPLQNDSTTGQPFKLNAKAGDVVVFPACGLHPYEVLPTQRATPLRYIQISIS